MPKQALIQKIMKGDGKNVGGGYDRVYERKV
jgi:hypothetical protein